MAFLIFYVTHPDEATAKQVAEQLLAQKLVACANLIPINSAFWWDGAIQHDAEVVSILKTTIALGDTVEAAIAQLHPYDVPCIMRMEVRANAAYEKWIGEMVGLYN